MYEQCARIHYAGRQCKRKEQVFPFWDVKEEAETPLATTVVYREPRALPALTADT